MAGIREGSEGRKREEERGGDETEGGEGLAYSRRLGPRKT